MREELETLKRIEELLQVLVRASFSAIVKEELGDEKRKLLYKLTGKVSVKEIAKRTGFSAGKISGIWQEWEQAGLLIKDGKQYKKVF